MKTDWPNLPTKELPQVELLKTCATCAYCQRDSRGGMEFAKCLLTGSYCDNQRRYPDNDCNRKFSGWRQAVDSRYPPIMVYKRPPRRSLLQWLYDTFLRIDAL